MGHMWVYSLVSSSLVLYSSVRTHRSRRKMQLYTVLNYPQNCSLDATIRRVGRDSRGSAPSERCHHPPPDRPAPAATLPTTRRCTPKPRLRSAERMGMSRTNEEEAGWLGKTREERGGRRGWTGGAASPFSTAATAEQYVNEPKVSRTKRCASFPSDFGAYVIGNERHYGWNSGSSDGIWAGFWAQILRTSKHRNLDPNSSIPNS
jgi:hypothetical protein